MRQFAVDQLARAAHSRDIDTLVDEELTEDFTWYVRQPGFNLTVYPGFDRFEGIGPQNATDSYRAEERRRKSRPWLAPLGVIARLRQHDLKYGARHPPN